MTEDKFGMPADGMILSMKKQRIPDEYKSADRKQLLGRFNGQMQEVVARYCTTPVKYRHCTFDMDSPSPQQQMAVRLFKQLLAGDERLCESAYASEQEGNVIRYVKPESHDGYGGGGRIVPCPLRPKIGVYLHGDVGRGKTHIMAAYANGLLRLLEGAEKGDGCATINQIEGLVERAAAQMISLSMAQNFAAQSPQFAPMLEKAEEFYEQGLQGISDSMRRDFSRKDLFVMDFDSLVGLYKNDSSILGEAIEAPILIIDDVHLRGEEQRARIVQDLLERRYNAGKRAIFMNSNLSPEQLIQFKDFDKVLTQRILSRCREMFYVLEIGDTGDYRGKISSSVSTSIEDLVGDDTAAIIADARLAERGGKYGEASSLYEKAGKLAEAGSAAKQGKDFERAVGLFEQAGDLPRAVQTASDGRLYGRASELSERLGKLQEAGEFAEKDNNLQRALVLYLSAENPEYAAGVAKKLGKEEEVISHFEQKGQLANAGQAARFVGQHDRASLCYEKAGQFKDAARDADNAGQLERAIELLERCESPDKWIIDSIRRRLQQKTAG